MLGLLTRVWVPRSMVISFKLETDPDMLVRKVSERANLCDSSCRIDQALVHLL